MENNGSLWAPFAKHNSKKENNILFKNTTEELTSDEITRFWTSYNLNVVSFPETVI